MTTYRYWYFENPLSSDWLLLWRGGFYWMNWFRLLDHHLARAWSMVTVSAAPTCTTKYQLLCSNCQISLTRCNNLIMQPATSCCWVLTLLIWSPSAWTYLFGARCSKGLNANNVDWRVGTPYIKERWKLLISHKLNNFSLRYS